MNAMCEIYSDFQHLLSPGVCSCHMTACRLTCLISQFGHVIPFFYRAWKQINKTVPSSVTWEGTPKGTFAADPTMILHLQSQPCCKMPPVLRCAMVTGRGSLPLQGPHSHLQQIQRQKIHLWSIASWYGVVLE